MNTILDINKTVKIYKILGFSLIAEVSKNMSRLPNCKKQTYLVNYIIALKFKNGAVENDPLLKVCPCDMLPLSSVLLYFCEPLCCPLYLQPSSLE